MKKQLLFIALSIIAISLQAQTGNVGINTVNPQTLLHIDGAKDNPATGEADTTQMHNDFVVTKEGNVGIGLNNPANKRLSILYNYNAAQFGSSRDSFVIGVNNRINISANSTARTHWVKGGENRTYKYDNNPTRYMVGGSDVIGIDVGSIDGYAYASRTEAYFNTPGNITAAGGLALFTTIGAKQTGNIDQLFGVKSGINYMGGNTKVSSTTIYDAALGMRTATIAAMDTIYAFKYDGGFLSAGSSVNHHYGLFINNINNAAKENYSIYTRKGKVSLGDVLVLRDSGTKPASSTDPSGENGEIRYDGNFIYIKTGNVWKRSALSTF